MFRRALVASAHEQRGSSGPSAARARRIAQVGGAGRFAPRSTLSGLQARLRGPRPLGQRPTTVSVRGRFESGSMPCLVMSSVSM
jgi:hypothetical protein